MSEFTASRGHDRAARPVARNDTSVSDPSEAWRSALAHELDRRFAGAILGEQATVDKIPTFWVDREAVPDLLRQLKSGIGKGTPAFPMLYDLTAIDERLHRHREDHPPPYPEGATAPELTAVYQLVCLEPWSQIRLKVPVHQDDAVLPSVHRIYPNADWYEREAWDMLGIRFEGHPHLYRILMPPTWVGHPLLKDSPARATEMEPFTLPESRYEAEQEALRFRPEDWGMKRAHDGVDFMFVNFGPNHPSVHGVFRVIVQLDGEEIVDALPEIGFHHRGAEKMGERQTWHTYIPYTDRVDYLGGVMNNLPYVLAVERLAGIEVPDRVKVARVMLCEMFRIGSHLLYLGTMAQDLGQLSPVFYMFSDRQKMYDAVEAITGFRMHPAWFRIGGLAADLPQGWERLVREFVDWMGPRLDEYRRMVLEDPIYRARTVGIGELDREFALDWGVTGPNLRATGYGWDLRKVEPYSGYDWFDFDIPIGTRGDCYDRTAVRLEEMYQSVRIVRQCMEGMPAGEYKARHPLTTPPLKEYTMQDIETLIHHFVETAWGPVIPAGESCVTIEGTKGLYSYYLTSDGGVMSYRTRIRTPSFPHLQTIPAICRGQTVADLIAVLGSIDFVMADVDR